MKKPPVKKMRLAEQVKSRMSRPLTEKQTQEFVGFMNKRNAEYVLENLAVLAVEDRRLALEVVETIFPELKAAIKALPEKEAKAKATTKTKPDKEK